MRASIVRIGNSRGGGAEMRESRPAAIVSPDEMNRHLRTVIIAPMTSTRRGRATGVPIHFEGRDGEPRSLELGWPTWLAPLEAPSGPRQGSGT
jgi:mRNA-degrading endonuclease toxin of MazEF toxin-antitoxin module